MGRFRAWRRRLLDFVGVITTLLSLLLAIAWIDSYWFCTWLDCGREFSSGVEYRSFYIESSAGGIRFAITYMTINTYWDEATLRNKFRVKRYYDEYARQYFGGQSTPWYSKLGWRIEGNPRKHVYQVNGPNGRFSEEIITLFFYYPTWFPFLVTFVISGPWLWIRPKKWRSEYRIKRNLCVTCGYDLRGSSERCPECHTPFPVKSLQLRNAPVPDCRLD